MMKCKIIISMMLLLSFLISLPPAMALQTLSDALAEMIQANETETHGEEENSEEPSGDEEEAGNPEPGQPPEEPDGDGEATGEDPEESNGDGETAGESPEEDAEGQETEPNTADEPENEEILIEEELLAAAMLADSAVMIDLSNISPEPGYTFAGNCITLNAGGTYEFWDSGSTTNVRIAVATSEEVTLILRGIEISSNTTNAAILLSDSARATILLPDDTDNLLDATFGDNTNGHPAIRVPENAELTIDVPQGEEGTGKLTAKAKNGAGIGAFAAQDNGSVFIRGGVIDAKSERGAGIGGGGFQPSSSIGGGNGGTITITGGTVSASSEYGAGIGGGDGYGITGGHGGNITIGGNAKVTVVKGDKTYGAGIGGGAGQGQDSQGFVAAGAGGTIIIEDDAEVSVAAGYSAGIGGGGTVSGIGGDGGEITIRGRAKVEVESVHGAGIGGGGLGTAGNGGKIAIEDDAQVTAISNYGAGIGGGGFNTSTGGNGGDITIDMSSKGRVTAISKVGAGIGGGCTWAEDAKAGDGGTIRIQGDGVVKASSEDGAGIGGGCSASTGAVIITAGGNGGNITISGNVKVKAMSGKSAGIGGGISYRGQGGHGGTITITGGKVYAQTGAGKTNDDSVGAGIGGGGRHSQGIIGDGGDGGIITITGGCVKAIAHCGAGIGGGGGSVTGTSAGSGGEIAISGGKVTATSAKGSGIGGGWGASGYGGDGGKITITGQADVTATGGEYNSGVGGGLGSERSLDGSHIESNSFGEGAELTVDGTATLKAYAKYGYALHTKDDDISGGGLAANLYLWNGNTMDAFHDSLEMTIAGKSRAESHEMEANIPIGYTSFAFTGNIGPYNLSTNEIPPRSIVYYDTDIRDIETSDTSAKAEPVEFGEPVAFTITYKPNGAEGEEYIDTQEEDPYTILSDEQAGFSKDGHYLLGWHTNPVVEEGLPKFSPGEEITLEEDLVLYAIWEAYVSVTYHPNGAPDLSNFVDSDLKKGLYKVRTAQEVEFHWQNGERGFIGWSTDPDAAEPMEEYNKAEPIDLLEDLILYAIWSGQGELGIVVIYDPNYEEQNAVFIDPYHYEGDYIVLSADQVKFSRSGYTFQGWSTNKEGPADSNYNPGSMHELEADLYLYAIWSRNSGGGGGNRTTYQVSYHSAYSKDTKTERYSAGAKVTVKNEMFGYPDDVTFEGWSTEAGGAVAYRPDDSFTMPSRDVHLYAVFAEIPGVEEPDEWLNKDDHYAYIIGYPGGRVRPDGNITRAEVATIYFRLLKDDVREENLRRANPFGDVRSGDWFNTAVSTLCHLGILEGSDGNFRPNEPITRAELAVIAVRFDKSEATPSRSFGDTAGHWAETSIRRAVTLGWVEGYPDGTFRPDAIISRAEMMALTNRVLERHIDSKDDMVNGAIFWPDNPEHEWFFFDVEEATNSHGYDRDEQNQEHWNRLHENRDWTVYEK